MLSRRLEEQLLLQRPQRVRRHHRHQLPRPKSEILCFAQNDTLKCLKNVKPTCALFWIAIVNTGCCVASQAQCPNMIGRWNTEITFANEEHHSLRFDAQDGGKGSLLLLDARSKVWGATTSSEAKWSKGQGNAATFSGPVEFLLGNVGRDPGTLGFHGEFETADSITGDVEFSPSIGGQPSRHGTFKATRMQAGKQ